MFIRKPRPSIQHHLICSVGVGGQSGKSTLALMLTAYLSISAEAQTVVVLDAATTPYVGLYECFKNIFSVTSVWGHTEGCPIIKVPLVEGSERNLLIVRVSRRHNSWQDLTHIIQAIQEDLINRTFKLTYVVTETNLQVDDPFMPTLLTGLEYSFLTFWSIWKRRSLSTLQTAKTIEGHQNDYEQMPIQWQFVHNPYDDSRPTDSQDFPSMKKCYEAKNPMPRGDYKIVEVSQRAYDAINERESAGDELWKDIYDPYLQKGNYRPYNLLPVYKRSEVFLDIMGNGFLGIKPINVTQDLHTLLSKKSEGLYSLIFSPHFEYIGVL